MDASVQRQTETAQAAADGKWVFLQDDRDAAKELLLEEQDGDVKGENKSIENAVEGQESTQDTEKYLWWIRSAWNDVSVRKALWDDVRPYVLIATLGGYTGLHVLAALASLVGCNAMQALFICLKHFTAATLTSAIFSTATRFLALMAQKASTMTKPKLDSLDFVAITNGFLIPTACFTCIYEVGAGVTVFQEVRQEEDFGWFLQLLADMARVHMLTAAIVLSSSLVFLMGTDLVATHRAVVLHYRKMMEYRKLAAKRRLELRAKQKPSPYPMIAILVVGAGVLLAGCADILFFICSGSSAHLGHADSAGGGDI